MTGTAESDQVDIIIRWPAGHEEYPDRGEVRVGPYPFKHQAQGCIGYWKMMEASRTGIAGAEFELVTHDPSAAGDRIQGHIPLSSDAVYELLLEQGADSIPFPDTWDLLTGLHGYDNAQKVWRNACHLLDDRGDDD